MPTDAMTPSSATVGHGLKQARTAMGLTLKQVAESMSIGMSTISEIESGKRRVSAVQLYGFAKLYQRPISYFLEESETSASFAILLRAADSASISKGTIIDFHELCKSYQDLRKLLGAPEMPGSPDYSSSRLTTLGQAEELAEAERASLGLNGQPIKDICELLEGKRGIKTFHLPEDPERFSGAFTYDEQLGACFLVNSRHPNRRRTFTVAHEYAHCIAHRIQLAHIDTCPTFQIKNPRERFADAFAACLLMPRRTVNEVLGQLVFPQKSALSAEVLVHLAMYFGASFEAMGWRLVALRRLSSSRWEELLRQQVPSSPTARLLGYSKAEQPPDTVPRQYKYLACKAYEMKLISFEKLAELLRRNYYELKEEFEQGSQEGDA